MGAEWGVDGSFDARVESVRSWPEWNDDHPADTDDGVARTLAVTHGRGWDDFQLIVILMDLIFKLLTFDIWGVIRQINDPISITNHRDEIVSPSTLLTLFLVLCALSPSIPEIYPLHMHTPFGASTIQFLPISFAFVFGHIFVGCVSHTVLDACRENPIPDHGMHKFSRAASLKYSTFCIPIEYQQKNLLFFVQISSILQNTEKP